MEEANSEENPLEPLVRLVRFPPSSLSLLSVRRETFLFLIGPVRCVLCFFSACLVSLSLFCCPYSLLICNNDRGLSLSFACWLLSSRLVSSPLLSPAALT